MCGLPSWSSVAVRRFLATFLLFVVSTLNFGCGPERQIVSASLDHEKWQPWQIIETKTGKVLSFPEWLKNLERYEIVYVGEEHYNSHHIDAAISIMSGFITDGIRPVLGMEMFSWDGQAALNDYLFNQALDRTAFLEQVQWKTNWGGAFENYEPLVSFTKDRRVPIQAMNPPKSLIRRVVKLGLVQARKEEEWKQWGLAEEDIVDDPAYRARILDQLQRCHGGGAEEDYRTMYEASMVRDEGMAKTLVSTVEKVRREKAVSRAIIVSYTGGGHIQYNLPVPNRVARRLAGGIRQTTVYLTSFDRARAEDIQDLIREPIADYIWLTPVSGQGPVQRCR